MDGVSVSTCAYAGKAGLVRIARIDNQTMYRIDYYDEVRIAYFKKLDDAINAADFTVADVEAENAVERNP